MSFPPIFALTLLFLPRARLLRLLRLLPRLYSKARQLWAGSGSAAGGRGQFPKRGYASGEYVEIESGKKNQRPQLLAAIAAARAVGGVLLIAKLDRLSRNAGFILALRDSGVQFACCDMPDANTLTVGLFAVIVQHERETISQRTKDALKAKKARGAQLGTPANLTEEVRQLGLETRQRNAREHGGIRQATALILARRAQGLSCERIAGELNALGFTARRGGAFSQKQVQRLLDRATAALAAEPN
jgi:DNA invertase Pin-like site-specific DNA recombinase